MEASQPPKGEKIENREEKIEKRGIEARDKNQRQKRKQKN